MHIRLTESMMRKIIKIDEDKCDGCGACAEACHEGAIQIINGKAKLVRDDFCDGLGDCLPSCRTGAISFEEKETAAYDEKSVRQNMLNIRHACDSADKNWPVQIRLVPATAPYFNGSELLVAADCTAFVCSNFHQDYVKNRITLIGCPKLDGIDYSSRLAEILKNNDVKNITVVRMEVPCCIGLENAVKAASEKCGKNISVKVAVLNTDGSLKSESSIEEKV